MEEKEGGSDWKGRQACYEEVLKAMENPNTHLLQQLHADLPRYLSDVNPNCLRTALSICELYFKSATSINYTQIAQILVGKCFATNRPGNAEVATSLLLKCIAKAKEPVLNTIFDELSSKSPKIVRGMISVLAAHLQATGNADAKEIIENLVPLQDHRDQMIRKEATATIALAKGAPSPKPVSPQARPKSPGRPQSHDSAKAVRSKSPAHKRRLNTANASSIWSSWVSKETLALLHGPKWSAVVEGLENLRKQFSEENGNPAACVYGLTTVFLGKVYTPKVMNQMVSEILFYMKEDLANLTDDAIGAVLHFVIDKLTDKRLEAQVFEMADLVCEIMTPPYVFGVFYPHLAAKNPQLPARIVNYFTHCVLSFGADSKLNPDEVSREMKPLCDHSDPNVRKAVYGCIGALASVFGDGVLESFRSLKQAQLVDVRKSMNLASTTKLAARTPLVARPAKQASPPKRSGIPEPTAGPAARRNSPKRAKPQPRTSVTGDVVEFIPGKLIAGLSRTGTALDCRKALDELEEILERGVELRGAGSIQQSEFTALFTAMRPWFGDSSTTVILPLIKALDLCIKLIKVDQVRLIPRDFLTDTFAVLNFTQKPVRAATLDLLSDLSKLYPNFVVDVFLPAFNSLRGEGRKMAVVFLSELDFDMNIQDFLPFIVNCLSDKSEEFRDASALIVQRFLRLPGASDAVKQYVESYPQAKKQTVLSMINRSASQTSDSNQVFVSLPTESQKVQRREKIDPFLPLKVMNGTEKPDALTNVLALYGKRYFSLEFSGNPADPTTIKATGDVFLSAGKANFEALSLVIDIVFLWWAQQSMLIVHQDGFTASCKFLSDFLSLLGERRRQLDQFEAMIVLPTVLECIGRGYSGFADLQKTLQKLTPINSYLVVLVRILGSITSIFAVQADIDTLLEILPTTKWDDIRSELGKTATRLHSIISREPSKNQRLFATSTKFLEYLKESGAFAALPESRPMSQCALDPKLEAKMKSPEILVYGWIVDLSSQDSQITIQALKSISSKLKTNPEIFEPHLEVLTISIINLIHVYLTNQSSNERLNKYSTFCLLSMFNETSLKNVIPPVFVHQLVYELLTHLSNGVNEAMLNQVLNALMVKLIDDCTAFAFQGLLSAIGEYENKENFTDRWIKLSLKCFEACGVRICEVGQETDVKESILMLEKFLTTHPSERLLASPFGPKIIGIVKSFIGLVFDKFANYVNSPDMKKRLGPNPAILEIVEQ